MAKSNAPAAAPAPAAEVPAKKGGLLKKILISIILLCVAGGLTIGGLFVGIMVGKKSAGSGAEQAHSEESHEAAPTAHAEEPQLRDPVLNDNTKPPVYIDLPPYVKNLDPAEGERFVQAKISLQMASDPKYAAMIEARKPQVNDAINRILASKKPSDIRTAAGQQALSAEILASLNDMLGYPKPAQPNGPWGPVVAVLFNSLIIQ